MEVQTVNANVILLHGLGRTFRSMRYLERVLRNNGYNVVNVNYDSRSAPIESLSQTVVLDALKQCEANLPVSFVTHSLGGILVRYYLANHSVPALHRVVMLGPPNRGSEIVDYLSEVPGFSLVNGEAGKQLGTEGSHLISSLGEVNFELGVIAGSASANPIYSAMLPGDDDGKVTVESTKVSGMKDHIVLPVTHTFMMRNKRVSNQVLHFLKEGRFQRNDNELTAFIRL